MYYRYLPTEYALDALQSGMFKIGRLNVLNDPYDCSPYIESGNEEGKYDLDYIHRNIGLLSYSKKIEDPVIWSHYADHHRGISLGFNYDDPLDLYKMKYKGDERPRLSVEASKSPDAILNMISVAFSEKAPSWSYESEYRQYRYLDGCKMIGPHYFYPINFSYLKEIVLGVRCDVTHEDIERIIKGTKSKMKTVQFAEVIEIKKCQTDERRFNMQVNSKRVI